MCVCVCVCVCVSSSKRNQHLLIDTRPLFQVLWVPVIGGSEPIAEIAHDGVGLTKHKVAVLQRRDAPVRIHGQEGGSLMLSLGQVDAGELDRSAHDPSLSCRDGESLVPGVSALASAYLHIQSGPETEGPDGPRGLRGWVIVQAGRHGGTRNTESDGPARQSPRWGAS